MPIQYRKRGGVLSRRYDSGGYLEGGDNSEAAQRARLAPQLPALSAAQLANSGTVWDKMVGGNHVQIGRDVNHPLSDEEAYAQLRQQNQDQLRLGALDPQYAAQVYGLSGDDLKSYSKIHKDYQGSLASGNMLQKIGKAANFEWDRAGNIIKAVAHDPSRLVTGVDPLSTKLWNGVLGTDKKPIVNQLGGATEDDFRNYEAKHGPMSLGASRSLSTAANDLAGMFGGLGAANGLGNAAGALSPETSAAGSDVGSLAAPVASPAASSAGSVLGAGASAAADATLPEIVVTGTIGAGGGAAAGALGGGALGAAQSVNGQQSGQSSDGKKGVIERSAQWIKDHPIKAAQLGLKAYGAIAASGAGSPSVAKPGPGGVTNGSDVLPAATFSRTYSPYTGDYNRYGMGPEHNFYGYADGGALQFYPARPKQSPSSQLRNFGALPGMRQDPRVRVALGDPAPSHFVSKGTGAGGREDNIDAKLSENEYVIDAETVALLGDGSPEKGAQKLDAMRKQIRQHKGKALARGSISPDAKTSPLQYLAEGGKVGALGKFLRTVKAPRPDPNANLKRIKATLDGVLTTPLPRTPPPNVPFEDFARGILQKSDSDILEGK